MIDCDHTGKYTIESRLHGYTPVRTYECHTCGARIAMDTLPAYLLGRMYGGLYRAPAQMGSLPPVDFCVVLSGPTAVPLARVCFGSLARTVATLRGVTFHLVNVDLSYDEFNQVCRMVPRCRVYTRPPVSSGSTIMGDDTEWSCNWVVDNCGNEQYVVLCHFDLFFVGDFLNYLRSRVGDHTGMLGQHCPFMLLNRRALNECVLRFKTAGGPFHAVPRADAPDQFFLYYGDDRRVPAGAMRTGFDTGELLELELRVMGWDTDAMRDEYDAYFYHFSGGGRVRSGPELESIRRRVSMITKEYGLGGDPAPLMEDLYE